MPWIGCGLGGGKWDIVSEMIESTLVNEGVKVFVYDPPKKLSSAHESSANGERQQRSL